MITATLSPLVNFLYYYFLIIIVAYPCTYKTFTVKEKATLCWQQLHTSRFLMHWCWVTHPYHLVLLSNVWCFHDKIMKSAWQWKALGNVLNEITQPQECICYMFSFLGTSWLLSVNMCDLGVSTCGWTAINWRGPLRRAKSFKRWGSAIAQMPCESGRPKPGERQKETAGTGRGDGMSLREGGESNKTNYENVMKSYSWTG